MERRKFFKYFANPLKAVELIAAEREEKNKSDGDEAVPENRVAIIQGRFCLAYQGEDCAKCHDNCPETGTITMDMGAPMVNLESCTGCGECQKICPAPTNAILLTPRK
jgi:Fe-S-cluster-containing hydrogenase component 2